MTEPTPEDRPTETPDAGAGEEGGQHETGTGPFDLGALRQLVRMMERHGLSEVSLKSGETQWKLRRGPEVVTTLGAPAAYPTTPAAPVPSPAAAPPAAPAYDGLVIKSPTVGTFYSAASPDDPPFVNVGSRVEPDTIVCLVEAMKVFNQIPAEVSGVISEVLVKNGDT